ncbi:amidohydrolase family protein [Maribellus sp. CM-23]|uniref:N-acetylglucosamine-6-phosphate deacetylase n=1 Tax=Maribellus sp. CM-23 TaxID=2781026 RepID=UPI001F29D631|nr:amidohydrolase family protein [Maribellus sp. CM-23]MCE4565049.1 amidohydrolase family protein [Maribellus sp. CM-23]
MIEKQRITLKGQLVTEKGVLEGAIRIEDGKITAMGDVQPNGAIVDFTDYYIVPGFIDLHMHGIQYALVDNGPDDLLEICRSLPQYGVTGFLPTVTPRQKGEDATFLSELSATKREGAEILGFHLEGPFLKLTGSLSSEAISLSDTARVESLIQAAKPYRAIFSVSPDVEGIDKLLPLMTRGNTPAFMTHTAATVKETQAAIELGVCHATHFYDVFPCPAVIEPGVRPCGAVEAVLADRRVSVDFILDGVHVDPIAVKMALACKSEGPGRVCLITDSNVGAGLEPGRFTFGNSGEIEFAYKGAPARLVKENVLAGSGLTMDQAVRNAVAWLDIDLAEAVKMASTYPAETIGLGYRKGKLMTGYDADFVILDKQLNVIQTWIAGKQYFK